MRKFFLWFLSALVVLLCVPKDLLAVASNFILPPDEKINVLGQNHNYSVTFRGNGEAIVTARIVFMNNGDKPLTVTNLRVPKVDPKDIIAFQVFSEPQCIYYQYQKEALLPGRAPALCETYQEPDYFGGWHGNAKYLKAEVGLRGDTVSVTLPKPVKPNASGSFILYYRAFGYAKKNLFGARDFTFETLKVEDRIQTLQVGIATDSDLVLRDTKGKVNYRFEESAIALKSAGTAAPLESAQLDQFVQQIGQGEIVKSASNLQPLDSYSVRGSYADSRVKLYAKEIIIGIVVSLAVLLGLIWGGKRLGAMMAKRGGAIPAKTPALTFVGALSSSFLAALLMIVYTFILLFVRNYVSSLYGFGFLLTVLIALVSLGVYGMLLVVPAMIVGIKRGLLWGLATFGLTIFWLVVDGIVILIVLVIVGGSGYTYPVQPLIGGFTEGSSSVGVDLAK